MVNTAVVVSASPNHLTFLLTGDGTVAGPTIANATILAAMPPGPLRDAWNTTYTNQAAMRNALLAGGPATISVQPGIPGGAGQGYCEAGIQLVATGVDVTAQVNQPVADVDTDAVSVTKAEINVGMSDTTGQLAYLHLRHRFSAHR